MLAGMEVVNSMHAGQSQGCCMILQDRMSGDAGAFPDMRGYKMMTPEHTAIQVRISG